jgi:hypothetical protein
VPALSTIWAPDAHRVGGRGVSTAVVLSDPLIADIQVYRGDSGRFRVRVNEDDSPVDLTAATWDADIRATADETVVLGSFTVTLLDTLTAEVVLPAAVSAVLPAKAVWDLQMTLDGEVQTLLRGDVTVIKDVSRT